MSNASGLRANVNGLINDYGEKVRVKYYTSSGASAGYDDDVSFSQSGNTVWVSGLVQAIDLKGAQGGFESVLVQQGKLTVNDLKVYFDGTVSTSGEFVKFGIGSPSFREYSISDVGVINQTVNNESVYKKVYLKFLNNGSIIGE